MVVSFLASLELALAAGASSCTPMPNLSGILERQKPNFVLIGEIHGTNEIPAAFVDSICAAIQTRRPIIVGVEMPSANQQALDEFMRSSGSSSDQRRLRQAPIWNEKSERTTSAIFQMIRAVRDLQSQEQVKIRLLAFDVGFDVSAVGTNHARELGMAAALSHAQAEVPDALVLALTGIHHANFAGWRVRSGIFPSAAGFLPRDKTLSFGAIRVGGERWGCQDEASGGEICGKYSLPLGVAVTGRGIQPDEAARNSFDAYLSVGRLYSAATAP